MNTAKNRDGKNAIFLDRDGTLIEDRGYLSRPEEVRFFPWTVEALKKLQENFLLFIVTNQSGIAKGFHAEAEVKEVNRFVMDWLRDYGVHISRTYTCPHNRTDHCNCIKPLPFFAMEAAQNFNINLKHSFAIGDHPHDVTFGEQFGGTGLYVLTGHGEKHRNELEGAVPVFNNVLEAADWIELLDTGKE